MFNVPAVIASLVAALVLPACAERPPATGPDGAPMKAASAGSDQDAPEAAVAATIEARGLQLTAAPRWERQETTSPSRIAAFTLPGVYESSADASLIIWYFGEEGAGTIQDNIDRWCDQFEQPDGRDSTAAARQSEMVLSGFHIDMLDLSGTYVAETSPGSGERVNEPGYRLCAAIVMTEAGPYYFKLVGPEDTVAGWKPSFEKALRSVRRP